MFRRPPAQHAEKRRLFGSWEVMDFPHVSPSTRNHADIFLSNGFWLHPPHPIPPPVSSATIVWSGRPFLDSKSASANLTALQHHPSESKLPRQDSDCLITNRPGMKHSTVLELFQRSGTPGSLEISSSAELCPEVLGSSLQRTEERLESNTE
ncbi:hypothetical protein CEXT_479501 [Caerostris extrusa]|uniref:Uncharacterized protein n=1 Tax=Caerostris extrusa TaxID=172846 RepID=A0AAV4MNN6_CAEEX|nr:hypothetical protein CEXT_479501 [Caerostris extrusa]